MRLRIPRVALIALIGVVLIGSVLLVQREPTTPEQDRAIAAAKTYLRSRDLVRDGFFQRSTYKARKRSEPSFFGPGWIVSVDFPGNYVGGHCTLWLDERYQVIRFQGGK